MVASLASGPAEASCAESYRLDGIESNPYWKMDTTSPLTLVFATHNANKVAEVQALLGDQYRIQSLTDIGCFEEIVEDASTLEGNARIKARHVVQHYGLDCFADDTGLEVQALQGAPGVHSARYAGPGRSNEANMEKLLHQLQGHVDRSAHFRTVICLVRNGVETLIEGTCKGNIRLEKSGDKGFGYDPLFEPDGEAMTFAEMTPVQKNAISHRGRAIRKMIELLVGELDRSSDI